MKPRALRTVLISALLLLFCAGLASRSDAEQRFIVRTEPGAGLPWSPSPLAMVGQACQLLGCTVQWRIDGALDRLFLVTAPDGVNPIAFVQMLIALPTIADAEIDVLVNTMGGTSDDPPPALLDDEPVDYFGTQVRGGYVRQPAWAALGIATAHEQFGLTGAGIIVAIIDTGVDPEHPALQPRLLEGYDFTRNATGASELRDLEPSPPGGGNGMAAGWVNQSTMAVLDQSTMAVLDDTRYQAFGHGTMVAGVIHLVAPQAAILPLKAFAADGTGYASDVLRAIYEAVHAGAKVLNMSFSFPTESRELTRAIAHATANAVVPVASVGNDSQAVPRYPAALPDVIGVASTADNDTLSWFSNFGTETAWIAAPGEGVVTTYPMGTWAAGWGTSFSAPFAAGAAALLAEVEGQLTVTDAAEAEGHAIWVSPEINRGRLDIPAAIAAWRAWLGLPQ